MHPPRSFYPSQKQRYTYMLDAISVQKFFDSLWADAAGERTGPETGFLAHYTSIPTLEAILKRDEVWLSNPLFMNDHEELAFGINIAAKEFRIHDGIRAACGTPARHDALMEAFEFKLDQISNEHAFDTYVMCFSLHHKMEDRDGKLSMWRGYGGNGGGAAIVLDTHKVPQQDIDWLIFGEVQYVSREERIEWVKQKLDLFAQIFSRHDLPQELFYVAVHTLLERFKLFALFTKHHGFREEQEWRLVYLKDRDRNGLVTDMLGYSIGPNGIEPKLKLNLAKLSERLDATYSIKSMIDTIILGPSISSPLLHATVLRMLETLNLGSLSSQVVPSGTPYRQR